MGDPALAKTMRDLGVKAPVERIVRTDTFAMIFGYERLKSGEFIVELECGHKTVTKNRKRAPCHECHEMILNGEDYHAFRFIDPDHDGQKTK